MKRIVLLVLLCFSFPFTASAETLPTTEGYIAEQHSLNPDQPRTEYPIVLAHGIFGFKKILFVEYFNQIPEYLRNQGYAVFATKVYPLGTVEKRASDLAVQIDTILNITDSEKVNIIAHSMGGLDARYLVSILGYHDRVASVTMLSTPNRGTYIADLVQVPLAGIEEVRKKVFGWLGLENNPNKLSQALEAINNCSEEFMEYFNLYVKDKEEVFYQSWSGRSSFTGNEEGTDKVSVWFLPTLPILTKRNGVNDGLVSQNSAIWGLYHGTVPADHANQVGIIFADKATKFDRKLFYQDIAYGLSGRGF